MKTGSDYLELANQFELLALFEQNPKLKADFEKQAAAYRKLAEDRLAKEA
jgi:hypothetical protein